ncbi:hypothetical protein K437DRAFT_271403, partial [Tilletiaria anomala UBC 951]
VDGLRAGGGGGGGGGVEIEVLDSADGLRTDVSGGGDKMRDPTAVSVPTREALLRLEPASALLKRAPRTPLPPRARRLMPSGMGAANDVAEAVTSATAMVVVRESFIASVE